MSTLETPRRSTGLARWGALGGVAYVVLFVIGVILIYHGPPGSDNSPQKIIDYYSDSGHRDKMSVGWILAALGIFFFFWFLSSLRQTVRRLEADDGYLTGLTTIGGAAYATLTLAALGIEVGIRTMSDDTFHHTVYPGLIHAADDAAWMMHAGGGAGVAAMIIAASLAGLRAGAVSSWLGWVGVAAGVLSLGLIIFFPWFVVGIWVLAVSIGMFMRSSQAPGAAQP